MKKPQLKEIRAIANEMVQRGAKVSEKIIVPVLMPWGTSKSYSYTVSINHARRIKRLVTRAKLPLGKAIDTHVGKYFDLKKVENNETAPATDTGK